MEEYFARLSKAGRVVCGRQDADGGYYCDEPVAAIAKVHEPPRYPERRLVALAGWRMDRKSIWRQTTSISDLRAHGRARPKQPVTTALELPALVCCPKCGTLQWLDAGRLKATSASNVAAAAPSRWAIRPPEPAGFRTTR